MKKQWIQTTFNKFRNKKKNQAAQFERLLAELEDFVSSEFNRSSRGIKEKLLEETPDDKLFFDMFLSNIRRSLNK